MKVLQRAPRKALILSPVASHPQNFGNRRRVYQTCNFLRAQGYEIHFLLYPMEPDWQARVQDEARVMRREWDSFQVIPSSRPFPLQSPAVAEHHTIDEWWDSTIGMHLSWLFAREHFDVFVVNYVFMSKAFEFAAHRTVKVLETHDRFAGRLELLRRLNARIESFYTTENEEKIALDRSDIVIAIKESEAEFYGSLTDREVISVPFWLDQEARPPLAGLDVERPLRAGFIGALNVVNVANMRDFLLEFESNADVAVSPVVLDVAGDVCHHLESEHPQVNLLGRVESLEEFYDSLDVVIVPMTLSTGLKIKTGEALAFGKAVVAMSDPFDGFPPVDEYHWLDSFADVCRALTILAGNRERLTELETRSRVTALLARRRMELGYRRLATAISRFLPTLLLITDQPVFEEGNAEVERLAQWAQLCSGQATTVVGYLGEVVPGAARRPELGEVEVFSMGVGEGSLDAAFAAWDELNRHRQISEIILSVDGQAAPALWQAASERCAHVTLDTWRPALAQIAAGHTSVPAPDYWCAFDRNCEGSLLSMTALRYRPRFLDGWKAARPEGTLVVLCGPDDSDRSGLEMLRTGPGEIEAGHVVTLAAAPGMQFETDFFEQLRTHRRPAVFLAIGVDANALALCDALGNIFAAPCLHIANSQFPLLTVRKDGSLFVCETYAELAANAADFATLARGAPVNREDTGWGRYKEQLVQRLQGRLEAS